VTVASPSPVFVETIRHGENGFLADAASWPEVLMEATAMTPDARQAMIDKAEAHVKKNYTGAAVADTIERSLSRLSS